MRSSIVVEQKREHEAGHTPAGPTLIMGFEREKQLINQVDRRAEDHDISRMKAVHQLLEQTLTDKYR